MRILLVEDNLLTAKGIEFLLAKEGFVVATAHTVSEARERLDECRYDLVLLDVGLPGGDGFVLASDWCGRGNGGMAGPVFIFLTARDDEESVVRGLGLGADDYVVKPFRNRELISRIRAALRRQGKMADVVRCGDLILEAGILRRGEMEIPLSALEYKIVSVLMLNAGQIVRRERLLDEIWDYAGNVVNDNTLTVYIKRIRGKVGENTITTMKGVGYRMEVNKALSKAPITVVADEQSADDFSDEKGMK